MLYARRDAMNQRDISRDKSVGDLGLEAFWFITHTLLAVAFLAAVIGAMSFMHPDPDSSSPKMLASLLAFVVPMTGGFLISRMQRNNVSSKVWISGLLLFSVVCVWVLDLPTGPGLCEKCGLVERLYRPFFFTDGNSGLMGGDGLFFGAWLPLSMIGYAVGARLSGNSGR